MQTLETLDVNAPIMQNQLPIPVIYLIQKPRMANKIKESLIGRKAYNILDDLNKFKSDITLAQLLDITPSVRGQLNQLKLKQYNRNDPIKIDVDMIQLAELTAVYTKDSINGKELTFLFDSSAACCCLDKAYLYDTRLIIDAPASTTLVLGDRRKAIPLGIAYDVPINIRPITIPADVIIVKYLSYP